MKTSVLSRGAGRTVPLSFRVNLALLLMVVVSAITALALYFTQRTEQKSYLQGLRNEFQGRSGYLLGAQEARQAEVSEECRLLASSVRIRAALEEEDIDDLYANAEIELRDILAKSNSPIANSSASTPHATFFLFLKADGQLLPPPGSGTTFQPWEEQIATVGVGPGNQQIGYVALNQLGKGSEINEVVITPILGPDGNILAALVLGFPPIDLGDKPVAEIKTGISLDGQLYLPGLAATDRAALSGKIAEAIRGTAKSEDNFEVTVNGGPCLLFYKILNPGSRFAPAYEVGLYSLAGSLASQERLRWRIVGIATVVLLIGMGASYFFSARLSLPVEQLAEVSAQNLARREEAEAARELTEQKYRSIFENAVEGIFLLAPDGRYLSANPSMARIFGYASPAEFIAEMSRPGARFYVDPARGEEFFRRIAAEGSISNFDCEVCRKDGQAIWISQNARAVRNANGVLLHLEGTLEDITERRQAAESLRTLNIELGKALADLKSTQHQVIQQERLRALGQMASGIAHDFNNSLMPVLGFSELLIVHPAILDDKKKTTGYLESIRTAAKDAASIVARLREFYRANENSDVFAAVDLTALARQIVSLTQPKWKGQAQARGAEIRMVEELGDVPAISGDESALREVLTNLIFNAVDAMPVGGTITLRTRKEDRQVVLEVADTGAGMSEEVRQRCLEPFFTTKGEHGTGLGLAMVFGIVQRHGGTIDLKTSLGHGTSFVLRFPVFTAVSPATAAPVQPAPSPGLRVLLVDDEPQVRDVLTAYLEIEGHTVQAVEHGTDGLRLFADGKFDLVITDKAMPGMSGDQMALEIKKISPNLPVVLLSGFNSTGENEKIPGINVIASKPITLPALREAIAKAMQPG